MPQLVSQPHPHGNRQILAVPVQALLALTIGGTLLLIGASLLTPGPVTRESATIEQRVFTGSEFRPLIGESARHSKHLEIIRLEDERALLSRKVALNSADYPFLQYELSGRHPGLRVFLFWRSSEAPGKLASLPLRAPGSSAGTVNLASHDAWKGQIMELGIDVYGDLRDKPVELHRLALLPHSQLTLIHAVWSDWTSFSPWDQTSINHLRGTVKRFALSPTFVAMIWATLSLLLLYTNNLIFRQRHYVASYIAIIMAPWLALDGLWQFRLSQQLAETRLLFSGKSQHEKHLADTDSSIYLHAQQLKQHLFPIDNARVFILHDSDGHNYERLKTQYYLLPNNIYNEGQIPPVHAVRINDYILVLGKNPAISYTESSHRLTWNNTHFLKAERVNTGPDGDLYRVVENPVEQADD